MNSELLTRRHLLNAICLATLSTSLHAQVIYGLDNARHFSTHHSGPYFVQMGSFKSMQHANQLKHQLATHTSRPVQLIVSGQHYVVRIGPLSSIADVRSLQMNQPNMKVAKVRTPVASAVVHQAPVTSTHIEKPQPQLQPKSHRHGQWYVGMDAGLMQSSMHSKTMTVPNGSNYPPPENLDQYALKSHHPVMLDLQAGRRWQRDQQWLPAYALGLRYQHVFTKNIQGTVTEYSLPEFVNYNYQWGVGADALSLYSKLDLVQYSRLMPYVDLGLGVSSARSAHYSETALANVTPRFSPDYASKRSTQFTYNLGAGIDVILTPNLLVSAGYEYQSFGKMASGFGQGPNWHAAQLKLGHLNTNMGLIGFTYLFNGAMPTYHLLDK